MQDYSSRRKMNIRKSLENKMTGDSLMGTEQAIKYPILVWYCMHRTSSCNIYMNQKDAQNSCD